MNPHQAAISEAARQVAAAHSAETTDACKRLVIILAGCVAVALEAGSTAQDSVLDLLRHPEREGASEAQSAARLVDPAVPTSYSIFKTAFLVAALIQSHWQDVCDLAAGIESDLSACSN